MGGFFAFADIDLSFLEYLMFIFFLIFFRNKFLLFFYFNSYFVTFIYDELLAQIIIDYQSSKILHVCIFIKETTANKIEVIFMFMLYLNLAVAWDFFLDVFIITFLNKFNIRLNE